MRAVALCCAALLFAAAVPVAAQVAPADCAENRVDLRGPFGVASFTIEVADTPAERSRGLMFRTEMAEDAGMLFIYEQPAEASFWMKNTLIPLDMIFTDARGTVRHVHANAIPGDLRPISGGAGILTVLEINGGLAAEIGIAPGAQLRHPALGPRAAWPC